MGGVLGLFRTCLTGCGHTSLVVVRGASVDSHIWGFLPREEVDGRIIWRLLPPERFAPVGREIAGDPPAADVPSSTNIKK